MPSRRTPGMDDAIERQAVRITLSGARHLEHGELITSRTSARAAMGVQSRAMLQASRHARPRTLMVLVDVHSKNVDVAGMQAVMNERGKGAVNPNEMHLPC